MGIESVWCECVEEWFTSCEIEKIEFILGTPIKNDPEINVWIGANDRNHTVDIPFFQEMWKPIHP